MIPVIDTLYACCLPYYPGGGRPGVGAVNLRWLGAVTWWLRVLTDDVIVGLFLMCSPA